MDPRVHHETRGPPQLERETAEIGVRIRIEPDLFWRQLAVKTPAFRVGGVGVREFPKLRNPVQLLRNGNLHVMARNAFMMGQRFQFVGWIVLHVAQVYIKHSGARSIRRRLLIKSFAGRFFSKTLHCFYHDVCLRLGYEKLVEPLLHRFDYVGGHGQIFRATLLVARQAKLLVLAYELEEGLEIAFETDFLPDLVHLILDTRHFLQAGFMNLFRTHVCRGRATQRGLVKLRAIFELPDAVVFGGALGLLLQESDQFVIGRFDRFVQCPGRIGHQPFALLKAVTFFVKSPSSGLSLGPESNGFPWITLWQASSTSGKTKRGTTTLFSSRAFKLTSN